MSKLPAPAALPALLLLALSACATPARGGDDYTAFVYAGCSQARYDPGSQYAADVDTALSSLVNSAGYTAYANYTSPSGATGLAGVYQCRSDLPAAVCGGCVKSAASKLSSLCNAAAGAAVQLRACFVRYGNDSFLGRQDTTVLFKKCGGESAGDTGVVAMRDAALGALVAASAPADEGSYRAGAAGYVQAMSQCVGDLGAKACSDCVSAASAQLKASCGYASAGEVYLGKCYARFWSNGAAGGGSGSGVPVGGGAGGTGSSNGVGGAGGVGGASNGYAYGGFVPNTYGQHDESGKTLAIIIGLVAAVAIVIVLLSFVRRAGGVGGKS
ncbi:cysteine-rich repeat secretory protein 12-like [Panicum miliaceum]|uniref:Cysteine-rich repeat secretory protein 12-like n=1 Tax=Panicum miliaceum TaxID=4540 RepID=A0A3L6S1R3_PANMI|nr:cysteine-rich repeat secretory protein 12-like [Panicum miliaceum]